MVNELSRTRGRDYILNASSANSRIDGDTAPEVAPEGSGDTIPAHTEWVRCEVCTDSSARGHHVSPDALSEERALP